MDPSPNVFTGTNTPANTASMMTSDAASQSSAASGSDDNPSSCGSPVKNAPLTPTNSGVVDFRAGVKSASGGGAKSKKKRKTPTDVNAPKKPVSAYITYLNERRETVKAENPSMSYPDILKKLAAEWSALSNEDRRKYQEEANK